MLDYSAQLSEAIRLFRSGRKNDARIILEGLTRLEPAKEEAWLWYASTFSSPKASLAILQKFVETFPASPRMKKALQVLQEKIEQPDHPPVTELEKREIEPPRDVNPITTIDEVQASRGIEEPSQPLPLPGAIQKPKNKIGQVFLWLVLIGLVSGLVVCRLQNQSLSQSLENTLDEYQQLALENGQHKVDLRLADQKNQELVTSFEDLSQQYKNLQVQYDIVENQNQLLIDQFNDLVLQYNDLQNQSTRQEQEFVDFQKTALTPPYITVKGREVKMVFWDQERHAIFWNISFDVIEEEIQRGYLARNTDHSYLQLTLNDGQRFRVYDYRPFVDSSSFTYVVSELYEAAPNDEEFIHTIWNIVGQMTLYSSEIGETPRFPLETLMAGGGDCEDTSILLASMLLAAPVDWQISLVILDSDHPTNPVKPNHVIVEVITDSKEYLIETTSKTEMTPYNSGVVGWYYDVTGR